MVIVLKRICAFIMGITLIFLFSTTAFAQSIDFSLYSASAKVNKIFSLDIYACGCTQLCGSLFKLEYNSDVVEFRSGKAENANSTVYIEDNKNGELSLLLLNTKSLNCSENTKLASVNFISKNGGSGSFILKISQVIDSNYEELSLKNNEVTCPFSISSSSSAISSSAFSSSNFSVKSNSSNSDLILEGETIEFATQKPVNVITVKAQDKMFFYGLGFVTVILIVTAIVKYIRNKNKDETKNKSKNKKGSH